MHSNRQNSHIFAVVLDKDTPEARAVRETPGEIYSQSELKQNADGSTASKQVPWDRSFVRGKQASNNGQGSGKTTVLLVSLVSLLALSLLALRFARLVVRQCRRVLAPVESNP